jgi:hypothetical protein
MGTAVGATIKAIEIAIKAIKAIIEATVEAVVVITFSLFIYTGSKYI